MKLVTIMLALAIGFGIGYFKGNKKGYETAQAAYDKKMSEYSILFTPNDTKLVKTSDLNKFHRMR